LPILINKPGVVLAGWSLGVEAGVEFWDAFALVVIGCIQIGTGFRAHRREQAKVVLRNWAAREFNAEQISTTAGHGGSGSN
jgi:hypothetical protein